jgi:ankyrin repeat protein
VYSFYHLSSPSLSMLKSNIAPIIRSIWYNDINTQKANYNRNMKTNPNIPNEQLLLTTQRGDQEAVLKILQEGADINVRDVQGRTPAMIATYQHNTEMVRALLQVGADVNIRDNNKENPLLHAGAQGWLDILRLAIEARADTRLTNRFGGISIIPASERGHIEIVRELLTRTDINVNHINNLGWTALLEAIILSNGGKAHQQIAQLLIDYGADVNLADKDGVTPLQHAHERGFTEIERILLQAGAH